MLPTPADPSRNPSRLRSALLSLLHVYLNCATRDGLNLLPFEYVLTKSVLGQDGVVVLSEFVGCSCVLNGGGARHSPLAWADEPQPAPSPSLSLPLPL